MKTVSKSAMILFAAVLLIACGETGGETDGDADGAGWVPDGDSVPEDGDEFENLVDAGLLPVDGPPSGTAPEARSVLLASSEPGHRDALAEAPLEVTLRFEREVGEESNIRVYKDKQLVTDARPRFNETRTRLSVPIESGLGVGVYDVLYTLQDGEDEEKGYFVFFVEHQDHDGEDLDSLLNFRENSISGPQYTSLEDYRLQIAGMVAEPVDLSYEDVLELPSSERVMQLDCVEGWSAKVLWGGVRLTDVLDKADLDEDATIVILHALDEYTTSLPLSYIKDNDLLLAHAMNGVSLPGMRGYPFELAAKGKWGYKWIKWVDRIELSDDESYRGFWEQRGYNNDADLDGPIFEQRDKSAFNAKGFRCGQPYSE